MYNKLGIKVNPIYTIVQSTSGLVTKKQCNLEERGDVEETEDVEKNIHTY